MIRVPKKVVITRNWQVGSWFQHAKSMSYYCKAFSFLIIDWPSGRRTLKIFKAVVAVHPLDILRMNHEQAGQHFKAKEHELDKLMYKHQKQIQDTGWYIRPDRQGHSVARRVTRAVFVLPSSYRGGPPTQGDMIPAEGE